MRLWKVGGNWIISDSPPIFHQIESRHRDRDRPRTGREKAVDVSHVSSLARVGIEYEYHTSLLIDGIMISAMMIGRIEPIQQPDAGAITRTTEE